MCTWFIKCTFFLQNLFPPLVGLSSLFFPPYYAFAPDVFVRVDLLKRELWTSWSPRCSGFTLATKRWLVNLTLNGLALSIRIRSQNQNRVCATQIYRVSFKIFHGKQKKNSFLPRFDRTCYIPIVRVRISSRSPLASKMCYKFINNDRVQPIMADQNIRKPT